MINRGQNFYWHTVNGKLRGVYYFLAMRKNNTFETKEQADQFIVSFCKHECGFEGRLFKCAKIIQNNWEYFKQCVELNR